MSFYEEIEQYRAADGKVFDTPQKAEAHVVDKVQQFLDDKLGKPDEKVRNVDQYHCVLRLVKNIEDVKQFVRFFESLTL